MNPSPSAQINKTIDYVRSKMSSSNPWAQYMPQNSYQPPPGPPQGPPNGYHAPQNGVPPPLFVPQNHHSNSFGQSSPAPPPPPYSLPVAPPPQHSMPPPQQQFQPPPQQHFTPSPQPQQHFSPPPQAPLSPQAPLRYPFIQLEKKTYGLLPPNAPNNARPILTVQYPSSVSLDQEITITRTSDYTRLATVTAHSYTTSKVDAVITGGGDYHFKKKFASQAGLSRMGGKLVWDVPGGSGFSGKLGLGPKTELVLSEEGGGMVARFLPMGERLGKMERVEGWFEMGGLQGRQFEEVFVTGIAELERRRRDAEDKKVAKEVIGAM